ncbi:MAG: DUF167 domain-containing protein [Candidatus Berkelbacteria bacterium]|nr:DUF167 domain-containing protein [Candidatus Berkelbacteria bacterium]
MKINIKVIPSAKVEQIQPALDGSLKVWLRARPKEGEANCALIKLLSKHFDISKTSINIVSGLTSRNKVVEIEK